MKRALLMALVVGLLAGSASANMFTLNHDAAMMLTDIGHESDGTFDRSSMDSSMPTDDWHDYGPHMQGAVGFTGMLGADGATYAAMLIGANTSTLHKPADVIEAAVGSSSHGNSLQGYDTYSLFIANDNNSDWTFKLYLETVGGNTYSSGTIQLSPGQNTVLSITLGNVLNVDNVTGIGFEIQGLFNGQGKAPSNGDDFHVSVVPVPAASILGLLGLGAAGLRLRKHA